MLLFYSPGGTQQVQCGPLHRPLTTFSPEQAALQVPLTFAHSGLVVHTPTVRKQFKYSPAVLY